jgi:site-specific recombinase XerD
VRTVKDTPEVQENGDWDDWLRDWTFSITAQHRPQTVVVYLRGLAQFRAHLAAAHAEVTGPEHVQRRHVESFLAAMATAGRGPATRRVRLMTLKAFYGWLAREPGTELAVNPTTGITAPDVPLGPVPVIPDEDLRAVLATCGAGSFIDLRDAAIVRVLIACGLRRNELCTLDVTDVDKTMTTLGVTGKGGGIRNVSIGGSKTALALSRYVRVRRKQPGAAQPALFLSARPDGLGSYRLKGGGVAEMIRRRCELAGVKVFHPHQLRHTWAHVNKVAGLSDEDLERMAGWSSPLMVRRYGRALADERARDAHARLATGDRL